METVLYRLRKGCNLTQEQLAILIDKAQAHISLWESAQTPMPWSSKMACYQVFLDRHPNKDLILMLMQLRAEPMSLQTDWKDIEELVGYKLD